MAQFKCGHEYTPENTRSSWQNRVTKTGVKRYYSVKCHRCTLNRINRWKRSKRQPAIRATYNGYGL